MDCTTIVNVNETVHMLDKKLTLDDNDQPKEASPIQTLPPEVLLLIFAESRPEFETYPYHFSAETKDCISTTALLSLGQVCLGWHSIIHSSPDLWTLVRVDLNLLKRPHTAKLLEQLLSYAKGSDLQVTLALQSDEEEDDVHGEPRPRPIAPDKARYYSDVIKAVERHSSQIVSLELLSRLDPFSRDMKVPNLRRFCFSHCAHKSYRTPFDSFPWLLTTKKLRQVDLAAGTFISSLLPRLEASLAQGTLSEPDSDGKVSTLCFLRTREGIVWQSHTVLGFFPNIRRAEVEFLDDVLWPTEDEQVLSLPFLEELKILVPAQSVKEGEEEHEANTSTGATKAITKYKIRDPLPRFLRHHYLPSLKSFSLDLGERDDTEPRLWPHSAWMAFSERCGLGDVLEELDLGFLRDMTTSRLVEVLASLPNVRRLRLAGLGDEHDDGYTLSGECLEHLVRYDGPFGPSATEDRSNRTPLLPRLNYLFLALLRHDILHTRLGVVAMIAESRAEGGRSFERLEHMELELGGHFEHPDVVDAMQRLKSCRQRGMRFNWTVPFPDMD